MRINCELVVNSDVEHLQQIYTGFGNFSNSFAVVLRKSDLL